MLLQFSFFFAFPRRERSSTQKTEEERKEHSASSAHESQRVNRASKNGYRTTQRMSGRPVHPRPQDHRDDRRLPPWPHSVPLERRQCRDDLIQETRKHDNDRHSQRSEGRWPSRVEGGREAPRYQQIEWGKQITQRTATPEAIPYFSRKTAINSARETWRQPRIVLESSEGDA